MRPVPPIWQCLAGYWTFTEAEAYALWRAMEQSRWTCATELHRTIRYFVVSPQSPGAVDAVAAFWQTVVTPRRILKVMDELFREHRLDRRTTCALQEKVLAMVTQDGHWK